MCYRKIARVCTGASNHAEDSIGAVSSKSCCVQIHIEVVKQVFSYPLEHEVLCSCSYKDASRILSCHASQCVELLCCNIASSCRVDGDSFLQHYLSEFCHSEAHDYEFYSGPCRVPSLAQSVKHSQD